MKKNSSIEVSLIFSSDYDYSQIITNELCLNPTKIALKEEIKAIELAKCLWVLTIGKKHSRAVSYQCDEMLTLLLGKEDKINFLIEKYALKVEFLIVIHGESGDEPEIILPKEFVMFAGKLRSEISFDIYIYS